MNRTLYKPFIVLLMVTFLVVSGCRKNNPPAQSKTQFIAKSPWKFSEAGIDQNKDGKIDLPLPSGILQTCTTDNLFSFLIYNIGFIDEGRTKCDASSPQTVPFQWKFLSNETEIEISVPLVTGISGPLNIVELTETRFSLSKTLSPKETSLPIPLNVVVVLVH